MTIKNVICDIDGVLMHDNVAAKKGGSFYTASSTKECRWFFSRTTLSQTGQDLAKPFCYGGHQRTGIACFIPPQWRRQIFLKRQEGKKPTWSVKVR